MRDDTFAWPLATELATNLSAEITASELPEVGFFGVLPGAAIPGEYCMDGMAWVRVVTVTPDGDIRTESGARPKPCGQPLLATFEVGMARCAPVPADDGTPPDMAEWLEASRLQLADMAAMRRAITCRRLDSMQGVLTLGSYTPAGPQGACLGGVWTVTITEF